MSESIREKSEYIGKVCLDYSHYSGTDLYSDGEIEEALLQVAKTYAEVEFPKVIEETGSWPHLYHLSPIRENIIEWLPMKQGAKVLEVGSGCGAITGVLSRKAGTVDCVDLSRQRSLINAYRHEYNENITIHVGNFQDIEPDLPCDYDVICLIGVFEYGQAYIGGNNPYETFLNILKRHLAPNGQIVIAIENKFGLKYFAGCREDHVGKLFEGIEDYPGESPARTFTQNGLIKIAKACGFSEKECHMYYPYPDYKFMHTLFSPERLPQEGELKDNLRNFDRSRLLLFDEKLAFENILREGEFPLFSNSYLMVLGEKPAVSYARYSNDREISKCIVTQQITLSKELIEKNEVSEGSYIVKRALSESAVQHIKNMAENYELLSKRYKGSKLKVCPCELSEDGYSIYFPVIPGRRLEELLDEKVFAGDSEGFAKLFYEFFERIRYGENESIADMDLIFSNILVDGDTWTIIDYEWVEKEKKYAKELAFRAMYCYTLEDERRNALDGGELLENIGITAEESAAYRAQEMAFQNCVTGNHKSLSDIRQIIGNPVVKPENVGVKTASVVGKLQVYVDRGEGFAEETSMFPRLRDGKYTLVVSKGVKRLRIDPANEKCMVLVNSVFWNDQELTINGKGDFCNGKEIGDRLYAFGTDDPGFTLSLAGARDLGENTLTIDMEILPLPESMGSKIPEVKPEGGLGRLFRRR